MSRSSNPRHASQALRVILLLSCLYHVPAGFASSPVPGLLYSLSSPSVRTRHKNPFAVFRGFFGGKTGILQTDHAPDHPDAAIGSRFNETVRPFSRSLQSSSSSLSDCPFTTTNPLHTCAVGYAASAGVTGGNGKPVYVVTNADDSLPVGTNGSLRWGLTRAYAAGGANGIYITFAKKIDVLLAAPLAVPSGTTIDGRGVAVRLFGSSVVVRNARNVIVHNIEVQSVQFPNVNSGVSIIDSTVVWLDHVRVRDAIAGAVEVVGNSAGSAGSVTISSCHLNNVYLPGVIVRGPGAGSLGSIVSTRSSNSSGSGGSGGSGSGGAGSSNSSSSGGGGSSKRRKAQATSGSSKSSGNSTKSPSTNSTSSSGTKSTSPPNSPTSPPKSPSTPKLTAPPTRSSPPKLPSPPSGASSSTKSASSNAAPALTVTLFRNWFDSSDSGNPQCAAATCHLANNLISNWRALCIQALFAANVRSEGNIFLAAGQKDVARSDGSAVVSLGDRLGNGAVFNSQGSGAVFTPPYSVTLAAPDSTLEKFLQQSAGPRVMARPPMQPPALSPPPLSKSPLLQSHLPLPPRALIQYQHKYPAFPAHSPSVPAGVIPAGCKFSPHPRRSPARDIPDAQCAFDSDAPLHECALGFARGVLGGYGRSEYVVTNASDSIISPAEGSLRWGLQQYRDGVYIRFESSMTIHLKGRLLLSSYTTIDGRGGQVQIRGETIVVQSAEHVIIHNIEVGEVDVAPYGTLDGIAIRASSMVWVDHCLVHNAPLGTVDLLASSDAVTVSHCHLSNYLLPLASANATSAPPPADPTAPGTGGQEPDTARVTYFGNFFEGPSAPVLHCQASLCHLVNNLFANWTDTCIIARGGASVRSLNNVYHSTVAGAADIVTANADGESYFVTSGDLLRNGARFVQSLPPGVGNVAGMPALPYSLPVDKADPDLPAAIKANSGPQF
ncbi:hypothetical protein CLOP_g25695 [Closterium sp. NIES-67]|nr:hypothetical protein CLOP_g25695 [Closterium sp. NIES-67]